MCCTCHKCLTEQTDVCYGVCASATARPVPPCRKFGLIGIWGGLIRSWLNDLLPDNAHELVNGRVHVVIAKAPTLSVFEVLLKATSCAAILHMHARTPHVVLCIQHTAFELCKPTPSRTTQQMASRRQTSLICLQLWHAGE